MKTLLSLLAFAFLLIQSHAAEPEKTVAGTWQVTQPASTRIYDISEGRTLKIVGGNKGDKRGLPALWKGTGVRYKEPATPAK